MGALIAGTLVLISLMHAGWALGYYWPTGDPDHLADLVVGQRPFPGPAACWMVAAATSLAAAIVTGRARSRWTRGLTYAIAAVFLLRGAGGLIVSTFNLRPVTAVFRSWDLWLYSPLCVALGVGCYVLARQTIFLTPNGRGSRMYE